MIGGPCTHIPRRPLMLRCDARSSSTGNSIRHRAGNHFDVAFARESASPPSNQTLQASPRVSVASAVACIAPWRDLRVLAVNLSLEEFALTPCRKWRKPSKAAGEDVGQPGSSWALGFDRSAPEVSRSPPRLNQNLIRHPVRPSKASKNGFAASVPRPYSVTWTDRIGSGPTLKTTMNSSPSK